MSMDDGQLLEAWLPSKDKEGKKNEKIKSLTINTIYPILRVYCFIVN